MKKAKYISPATAITEIRMEGMIAQSLVIGNTSGDQQLVKEQQDWDIWGGK